MSDLNCSDVSREERIGPTEGFGAFVNGRDGAEADELVVVEPEAAVVIAEELFIWGGDAGVAAPNLMKKWWHDAVVHVTGENKIEIIEMFANGFFFQESRGVDEENFGFAFREFFESVGNFFERIDEDFEIFGAGMKLAVVVFWWKREAIDAVARVHVKFVV